tara:strand:- start:1968 stop:2108 length:141 start_codon:yes stop_codon:yes gene_type:complete
MGFVTPSDPGMLELVTLTRDDEAKHFGIKLRYVFDFGIIVPAVGFH